MSPTPAAGESYTIRQKVFKIWGNAFHIYGADGSLAGYCRQKALKLKEDLRFYTDESMSAELFVIKARSVIDFGATYDVKLPGMLYGRMVGATVPSGVIESIDTSKAEALPGVKAVWTADAKRVRFAGQDVPRPAFWGGFRIEVQAMEFWQGRPDRLHDRVVFERQGDGWTRTRLYP